MKWRRFLLWGVLAFAVVAGLVYAFWPRPVPVDLADAARGSLVVTVDEEGETRVRDVFVLSAPVTGRLRRIESEAGDEVVAGETVVARIEPADPSFLDVRSESQARAAVHAAEAAKALAHAELTEADAELEFAQAELERARRLIRTDTISQRALDDAERVFKTRGAAVATAEAALSMRAFELDQARAQLVSPVQTQELHGVCECVDIPSPVSGRILRLLRESEAVVEMGEPLVEIGNPGDLEIVADLLSSEAVKVEPGQRVVIDEWGGRTPLAGLVRRVEPYGFTKVSALGIEEQRVNVIIDFSDPPERWRRLGHGYRVEVRIVLWEGRDVLKVPLTALFRDGERWAVFVEEDGRARRRHVVLGHRTGLEAEITSGLEGGARVVLHPSDRIVDGIGLAARS
ncbi:MAG: HlyD family efflux transporter periplasmic adaptor subunit [Rhodospirillales bacterium]|nr:HlyD family efflux transporter periplasmic adaptor subunit [Rhodospirillales bacterium]